MSTDFVSIAAFLEYDELQIVRKKLDSNGIIYVVNERGSSTYDVGNYYEIKVNPKDVSAAKEIINSLKVSNFLKSRKCPKCGSMVSEPVTGLNIFQKFLYLGTTPVRCIKCKTKYVL